MPLPATGTLITMSQVRNYFGGASTPILMSFLGTYIGIGVGTRVNLSASFGGR